MTDPRLAEADLARELAHSRWERRDDAIVRELELENFGAVIAAVNRIAAIAEEVNHHPDLSVHGWNKLTITLSTHSAGGITARDLALARRIDGLV